MVRDIRAAEQIRGQIKYGPLPGEGNVIFRRSLFAVRDIKKGSVYDGKHAQHRPGQGLAPKYYSEILGRRAEKDSPAGRTGHEGYGGAVRKRRAEGGNLL